MWQFREKRLDKAQLINIASVEKRYNQPTPMNTDPKGYVPTNNLRLGSLL